MRGHVFHVRFYNVIGMFTMSMNSLLMMFSVDDVLCWWCSLLMKFSVDAVLCWWCSLLMLYSVDVVLCWKKILWNVMVYCVQDLLEISIFQTNSWSFQKHIPVKNNRGRSMRICLNLFPLPVLLTITLGLLNITFNRAQLVVEFSKKYLIF